MIDSINKLQPDSIRLARLLLQLFKNQNKSNSKTIAQFVQEYAQELNCSEGVHSKKDQQLLIAKINHYKLIIQIATKESQNTLKSLQHLKNTKYAQIENVISHKQQTYLDFYSENLSNYCNPHQNDEQLSRIKILLSNGLWGNLPRLNQRLFKLSQLQSQEAVLEQ